MPLDALAQNEKTKAEFGRRGLVERLIHEMLVRGREFSDIFDQIVAYAAGKPINVVNPKVLESASPRR